MRLFSSSDPWGHKQGVLLWTALFVFVLIVFVLDILTPRGFESDELYLPLILVVALFGKPSQALALAVLASVLSVIGFFPSHGGIATGWAVGNLALGLLAIWLTTLLMLATRNLWTANRELQTEVAHRLRVESELKEALAVKDDFLGMVSHEMRTPLTTMMGSISLLENPDMTFPEEEKAELMTEMRLSSERLAKTIDNMLALARVQSGRRSEPEVVPLRKTIDEQVAQHARRYAQRQIRVHQAEGAPTATGSVEYVRHVVSNLLENAEKYSPDGDPIDIELDREGDEVVVRVLDRGVGVTDDEAQHIFEPFYRSPRIASGSSGLGIGLSVCKRLVEEQGGRIWAIPRPGGGSEFGFSLPCSS